jgi:DNA-binding CsgD family transcriptional regulator/tetratricopeptide (TPR) repeat protein
LGARDRSVAQTADLGPGDPVFDAVAELVDHHLLFRVDPPWGGRDAATPRFGMLETIREYGLDLLSASGEGTVTRAAHARYFLGLAERTEAECVGPDAAAWFSGLEVEHDNLRAALRWALDSGHAETALRLAAGLWPFWESHGYHREGHRWLEQALAAGEAAPAAVVATALHGLGEMATRLGDLEEADRRFAAAIDVRRHLGDRPSLARSLNALATVAIMNGDHDRATSLAEQALAIGRETGSIRAMVGSLGRLGVIALWRGDLARSESLLREARRCSEISGDVAAEHTILSYLAIVAERRGEHEASLDLNRESLSLARALGDKESIAIGLHNVAVAVERDGAAGLAAALYAESTRLASEIGDHGIKSYTRFSQAGVERKASGDRARVAALAAEGVRLVQRLEGRSSALPDLLEGVALLAVEAADHARAARLFGAASQLRPAVDTARQPERQAECDTGVAATRQALGDAFLGEWTTGRTMQLHSAFEDAQAAIATWGARASQLTSGAPPAASTLTAREREVLRLLVEGAPDQEIAQRLAISRKTASNHVARILEALGVANRTAAAALAVRRGLI